MVVDGDDFAAALGPALAEQDARAHVQVLGPVAELEAHHRTGTGLQRTLQSRKPEG